MKANSFGAFLLLLVMINSCTETNSNAQTQNTNNQKRIGGQCEGCEAIYENKTPFTDLDWQLTLPGYNDKEPKLHITGIVYKADGKSPAAGTVLYFYQTNQAGIYPQNENETGWGRRHGYIRGWLKTNSKGEYSIKTLKPGAYPNRGAAAHIHCIVKEDKLNEYYIGDFLFEDDPLLTSAEKSAVNIPGGSGMLKLREKNGILYGTRNIYLGKQVLNYPIAKNQKSDFIVSGLAIGADCPAFDPTHVSGPDKGKSACPMCKYGKGQGIMIWWNKDNLDELSIFASDMEKAIGQAGFAKLRLFIIYMNPQGKSVSEVENMVHRFSADNKLEKVAVTFIPSPTDTETAGPYHINPEAENTIFVYRRRKVIEKFINHNFKSQNQFLVQKLDLQLSREL